MTKQTKKKQKVREIKTYAIMHGDSIQEVYMKKQHAQDMLGIGVDAWLLCECKNYILPVTLSYKLPKKKS